MYFEYYVKIKPDEYTANNSNNYSKCQLFGIINKVRNK